MAIIAASLVICFTFLFAHLPNFQSESAYLPANLTANLPTRLCDYLITCQPADLPSCLLGIMPNCLLAYLYSSLHVNLQIHLPAYLHTCQPTYLLTFPPTCLPNCLHTCLTGPAQLQLVVTCFATCPGGWVAWWPIGFISNIAISTKIELELTLCLAIFLFHLLETLSILFLDYVTGQTQTLDMRQKAWQQADRTGRTLPPILTSSWNVEKQWRAIQQHYHTGDYGSKGVPYHMIPAWPILTNFDQFQAAGLTFELLYATWGHTCRLAG